METWQTIGLMFAALVLAALAKEAARRVALGLLAAIIAALVWAGRSVYWLLFGWWFGILRRRFTGSAW